MSVNINKFTKGRVAVFIDAANIFYSQKTLKWKISYEKLKEYFEKECGKSSIFIYTAVDDKKPNQEKFVNMLKRTGFIVKTKPVKKIRIAPGVYEWKGNADIELSMDMIGEANNYDTAILLSGDSDFSPAVDKVKSMKKRVLVMSVKGHISKELLERAKFISLKKLRDKIELVEKEIPPPEVEGGSSREV